MPPSGGAELSVAVREGGERGAAPGGGVLRLHNMAGAEPFAAVVAALRGCYAEAAPLETFIRRLRESGAGEAEVLRGDDAPCYRTFVGQCLVCVPRGARAIPRPFTFQQVGGRRRGMARSHLRRAGGGRSSADPAEQRAPPPTPGARARPPGGRVCRRWASPDGKRGRLPALGGRGEGAVRRRPPGLGGRALPVLHACAGAAALRPSWLLPAGPPLRASAAPSSHRGCRFQPAGSGAAPPSLLGGGRASERSLGASGRVVGSTKGRRGCWGSRALPAL